MPRIRVIQASRLLYGTAVLFLAVAVVSAVVRWYGAPPEPPAEDIVAFALQDDEDDGLLSTAEPEAVPRYFMEDGRPLNLFAPVEGDGTVADTLEPDEQPHANEIRIEVVRRTPHPTEPKRVLIYHTHTWEAYEQIAGDAYQETEKWRTKNPTYNIVRVGEELAKNLRALGMEVVHDTTEHEPPALSTAYARSLATLEKYRVEGQTFDYYIDLHRDAYSESMKNTNTVKIDGLEVARLRVLIGKGTGQVGGAGFEQKPNWEANLVVGTKITEALNAMVPDLARPLLTKGSRYNQHFSEHAVLVEVGNNKNTLAQALAAMPYLARAVARAAE